MSGSRAEAVPTVEPDRARRHQLARQHLEPRSATAGVVPVADDLVGLHATDPASPYLSLHARMTAFRAADLEQALYERRSLLRLKCMRGTVFVVSRELAPVLFAATRAVTPGAGPPLAEPGAGGLRQVGAAGARRARGRAAGRCGAAGAAPRRRQAARRRLHALRRGADRPEPDGPATLHDVAWWMGLPVRRVRAAVGALGAAVEPVRLPGASEDHLCAAGDLADLTAGPAPAPGGVALLPQLDPFLMGYHDRDRLLDPTLRRFVVDRGGNATSVALDDGRVVGVWDLVDRPTPTVRLLLFDPGHTRRNEVIERCAAVGAF